MSHVIQPVQDGMAVAFGLEWEPIIGDKPRVQALRAARAARGSHYVMSGREQRSAVGHLKLAKADQQHRTIHAVAALFAKSRPSMTAAAVVDLPGGRCWTCASHLGTVVAGSDTVHPSRDAAVRALDDLIARFDDVAVFGDLEGLQRVDFVELIDRHADIDTALRPAVLSLQAIPPTARIAVVSLAMLVGGHWAWSYGVDWQARRALEARGSVVIDPAAEWARAIASFEAATRVSTADTLATLVDAIGRVPPTPGRWQLGSIECTAISATTWACDADYVRTSSLATNRTLAAALPSRYDIRFTSANQASISWQEAVPTAPLSVAALPTVANQDLLIVTLLQQIAPALGELRIDKPTSVSIPPPVVTYPDGRQEAVLDAGLAPRLVRRELHADGPLRSLAVWPATDSTALRQITVRYTPGIDPNVNRSTLNANIKGVAYAQM